MLYAKRAKKRNRLLPARERLMTLSCNVLVDDGKAGDFALSSTRMNQAHMRAACLCLVELV